MRGRHAQSLNHRYQVDSVLFDSCYRLVAGTVSEAAYDCYRIGIISQNILRAVCLHSVTYVEACYPLIYLLCYQLV